MIIAPVYHLIFKSDTRKIFSLKYSQKYKISCERPQECLVRCGELRVNVLENLLCEDFKSVEGLPIDNK